MTSINKEAERNNALEFMASLRGQYIIAQALHYGIEALNMVEESYREVSNLSDMEYLRDNLYQLFIETPQHPIILDSVRQSLNDKADALKDTIVPTESRDDN